MIKRSYHQPLINNECVHCGKPTTAEGIACREHWDLVEGPIKALYVDARCLVAKNIYSKEEMK